MTGPRAPQAARERRRLAIFACAIAAALGASIAFRGPAAAALQSLLAALQSFGPAGLALLAASYVVACVLFVPGSMLTLGAGFLAAALWPAQPVLAIAAGTAAVSAGSTAGAAAAFLVGRTLAREAVAARLARTPRFAAVDRAIARRGFRIVLLLRLSPAFPFNFLNYALGLTPVPLRDYVLASWIGMLPGTVMYVYLGASAGSLANAAAGQGGGGAARSALLLVGLAATAALVVYVTRTARAALAEATAEDAA